jgi:hypothetical protein
VRVFFMHEVARRGLTAVKEDALAIAGSYADSGKRRRVAERTTRLHEQHQRNGREGHRVDAFERSASLI